MKSKLLVYICVLTIALLSCSILFPQSEVTTQVQIDATLTAIHQAVPTDFVILPISTFTRVPIITVTPSLTPTDIQIKELLFRPSCGSKYEINSGEQIELNYGLWSANGEDLIRATYRDIKVTLVIDGAIVQGSLSNDFLPMSEIPCGDYLDGAYWMLYIVQLPPFSNGEHNVEIKFTFLNDLTDGFDLNKDGKFDIYKKGFSIIQKYIIAVR